MRMSATFIFAVCLSPFLALALPSFARLEYSGTGGHPAVAGRTVMPVVAGFAQPAQAAEEFSANSDPSAGLLKGGGGKIGQGIRPGTPIGSKVPPARDLRPNLVPNRVDNPDARHTNITNRADRNKLNSPNH